MHGRHGGNKTEVTRRRQQDGGNNTRMFRSLKSQLPVTNYNYIAQSGIISEYRYRSVGNSARLEPMGHYRYGTQLIPTSKSVGDKVPIPTSGRYGLGTDRRRPVSVPRAEHTEWIPVGKIPTDYHPCN